MRSKCVSVLVFAVVFTQLHLAAAQASYLLVYSGTTPTGWTDTTGVFGPSGAVYSGVPFSGRITFDPADYPQYTPFNGEHDANPYGSPTPGYSNQATLNGVTVAQPDTSSYWGARVGGPGNANLNFYFGAWNDSFWLAFDAVGGAATYGITQPMLAASNVPNFVFTAADMPSYNQLEWQDGQGGRLATLQPSYVSLTYVPEIDPAGIGSVLAVICGGIGLLERRRQRA